MRWNGSGFWWRGAHFWGVYGCRVFLSGCASIPIWM